MALREDIREDVLRLLEDFKGIEPLKKLFWTTLDYQRENDRLFQDGWPKGTGELLAEDPTLIASGGYGGDFHVIYARLADDQLRIGHERRVVDALSKDHRNALFVFSNRDQNLWHFVNVPYDDDPSRRRVYRRITVSRAHT